MKRLLLTFFLFAWVPFFPSCSKNISVGPTGPTTPTFTPTATPACSLPSSPAPPTSGIYWSDARIQGLTFTNGIYTSQVLYFCVSLLVNGVAETTDTVTVTGPGGLNVTLPYSVVSATSSDAEYQTFQLGTLVPGGSYVITTVTTAGTAAATLTAPGGTISLASDGSNYSWTQGGQWNTAQTSLDSVSGLPYYYDTCSTASYTTNPPASAYPVAGNEFALSANCSNYTTSITNAVGQYWITQNSAGIWNFPTVTSPSATSDIFSLSTNMFNVPGQSTVQITLQTAETGTVQLSIFDAAGDFMKTLSSQFYSSLPSSPVIVAWDGKDKYGQFVPNGLYFVYLNEPTDPKFLPLLVER